jgi:hypothetical protein
MKKLIALIVALILVLIFFAYHFFKMPTKDLKIYSDINTITKAYPMFNKTDTFFIGDSLRIIQHRISDDYSFVYEMNTGEYDSIYYFGLYPSLGIVDHWKLDFYKACKKDYRHITSKINARIMDSNFCYLYALYKNGKISYCKTRNRANVVRISPYYIMFRNKQKFVVSGRNYENYKAKFADIYFEPMDSMYSTKKDVEIAISDSTITPVN